jgi:hypothetical protein
LDHVHHWVIEPANGVTSPGVCQLCGAEKEFTNTIDDNQIHAWSKIHSGRDNRKDGGDNFPNGHHVMGSMPS